jgi:hypothetical protein
MACCFMDASKGACLYGRLAFIRHVLGRYVYVQGLGKQNVSCVWCFEGSTAAKAACISLCKVQYSVW